MIERVTASDVLADCRRILGLSDQGEGIDDALLAALIRRSAGTHCPCSRATLRASVLECTQDLADDGGGRSQHVDETIEALTVGGDLLELDDVVTEDSDVRQTWVFAAPPGFVVRPDGTAFIFGIVPDQDAFLPRSLGARVRHRGFTRSIDGCADEALVRELREQGLQEMSESVWLKRPRPELPNDMLSRADQRLERERPIAAVNNLKILDSTRPVTYYSDRWVDATNQTGKFVARRPQQFGAPMWCLVRLEDGVPVRLLDFPFEKTRWRACDAAWHLQMAIDHCRDQPQRYRRSSATGGVRLDFFGPLPQWAQRRLTIFGNPVPPERSLFSYVLPRAQVEAEAEFVESELWLRPTPDSE